MKRLSSRMRPASTHDAMTKAGIAGDLGGAMGVLAERVGQFLRHLTSYQPLEVRRLASPYFLLLRVVGEVSGGNLKEAMPSDEFGAAATAPISGGASLCGLSAWMIGFGKNSVLRHWCKGCAATPIWYNLF